MKAYVHPFSSNAKRIAITAAELGIDMQYEIVDFAKGEHKTAEYLAMNPNGKVPVLDDDGYTLWESAAAAWYMAELNPSKGLLPPDIKARADQMRWMFWNSCHLESALLAIVHERLVKPATGGETNESICEYNMEQVDRYLPVLNGHLEGRAWIGQQFSMADISLGVTLELCAVIEVDLSQYPHLSAWLERLQERPSWNLFETELSQH